MHSLTPNTCEGQLELSEKKAAQKTAKRSEHLKKRSSALVVTRKTPSDCHEKLFFSPGRDTHQKEVWQSVITYPKTQQVGA